MLHPLTEGTGWPTFDLSRCTYFDDDAIEKLNLTFYEELGVPATATDEQIRIAYRSVAKKLHPDVNPGMEEWADAQMQRLNTILDTLTDPSKRKAYDAALEARKSYEGAPRRDSPPPAAKYAKRTWMQIVSDAEGARRLTVTNREQGMEKFAAFLKTHPNEPMIVYKRGEALAELGDREGARRDFASAAAMFRMEKWQKIAQDAARRLEDEGPASK